MSDTFRKLDRATLYLMPPSMDDWLPEGQGAGLCHGRFLDERRNGL
jgi:hypothetical protein